MARSRFVPAAAAFLLAALAAPALALPGGGEGGEAGEIERAAKALREKARLMRDRGSVEDADHLERKAADLEGRLPDARARDERRAVAKARIEEIHAQARQAKEEGRVDDARALMKEAEAIAREHLPQNTRK